MFQGAGILRTDIPDHCTLWEQSPADTSALGYNQYSPTFTFSLPSPVLKNKKEITQKLLVQVPGIAQKERGWLEGQDGEGCWVTWAIAASLSASPSRKILTLSIFTGTVLPLHSTSLIVAACFARVWVISACTEHTQLRSLNLQGCKTEPPEFILDLTTLKSKGFLGKCCFPQSLGLLVHFCSILALEWFAAAIFMLSTVIMNISSWGMQINYLQFFCKKTFSASRPQSHLHQLIHGRLVTWENQQIEITFPFDFKIIFIHKN